MGSIANLEDARQKREEKLDTHREKYRSRLDVLKLEVWSQMREQGLGSGSFQFDGKHWVVTVRVPEEGRWRLDISPDVPSTVAGMSSHIRVLEALINGTVMHWEGVKADPPPAPKPAKEPESWWRRAWRWLVDLLLG